MENLGIDGKLLLAQLINFALFFYIFKKYVAAPFSKFLNQEKNKEHEKEKLLEDAQKREKDLSSKEREMKNKMRAEFDAVVKKAQEAGSVRREEIIAQAKSDARLLVSKARKQIEDEIASSQQDMKKKVADLSIFIVENALADTLDEESSRKITQRILKNLPKK